MATRALPQAQARSALGAEVGAFLRHIVFLLLLAVPLAENVRGSKRWIAFGSFNFQPSELGKVLLILFLAAFVADRSRRLGGWRVTWSVVWLAGVAIVLVFDE